MFDLHYILAHQDLPEILAPTFLRLELRHSSYNKDHQYTALRQIITLYSEFTTDTLMAHLPARRTDRCFFAYIKGYRCPSPLSLILIHCDHDGDISRVYHFLDRATITDAVIYSSITQEVLFDFTYDAGLSTPNIAFAKMLDYIIQKMNIVSPKEDISFPTLHLSKFTVHQAMEETLHAYRPRVSGDGTAPYFWIMFPHHLNPADLAPDILCPKSLTIAREVYRLFSSHPQLIDDRAMQLIKEFKEYELDSPENMRLIAEKHKAHLKDFNRPIRKKVWEEVKVLLKKSWGAHQWKKYWEARAATQSDEHYFKNNEHVLYKDISRLTLDNYADFLKEKKIALAAAIKEAEAEREVTPELDHSTKEEDLEFKQTCIQEATKLFEIIQKESADAPQNLGLLAKKMGAYPPETSEPFSNIVRRAQQCGIPYHRLHMALASLSARKSRRDIVDIAAEEKAIPLEGNSLPPEYRYLAELSRLLSHEEIEGHACSRQFQLYQHDLSPTTPTEGLEVEIHQAYVPLCIRIFKKMAQLEVGQSQPFLQSLSTPTLWFLIYNATGAMRAHFDPADLATVRSDIKTLYQDIIAHPAPWTTDEAQIAFQEIIRKTCADYVSATTRFWQHANPQDKLSGCVLGCYFFYREEDGRYCPLPEYNEMNPIDLINSVLTACYGTPDPLPLTKLREAIQVMSETYPHLIGLDEAESVAPHFVFKPSQHHQDLFFAIAEQIIIFTALQATASHFFESILVKFAEVSVREGMDLIDVLACLRSEKLGFLVDYNQSNQLFKRSSIQQKMSLIVNTLLAEWHSDGRLSLINRLKRIITQEPSWVVLEAYGKKPLFVDATDDHPPTLTGCTLYEKKKSPEPIATPLSLGHRATRKAVCKKIGEQLLKKIEEAEIASTQCSAQWVCQCLSALFCCVKSSQKLLSTAEKEKLLTIYTLYCELTTQVAENIENVQGLKYAELFGLLHRAEMVDLPAEASRHIDPRRQRLLPSGDGVELV